jgi:hypothetical protein
MNQYSDVQDNILTPIHEGMGVFDANGDRIGTVKFVRFGDENANQPGTEVVTAAPENGQRDSLIENIAEAVVMTHDENPEIEARLLRSGYIRIDRGLLRGDRFAGADDIAAVIDDRVVLKLTEDQLLDPWQN